MQAKNLSVFYPDHVLRKLQANAKTNPQIKSEMEKTIHEAQRFITKEDSELWNLIVNPAVIRSHYVHKNSLCPVCGRKRLLYDWEIDPVSFPWKIQCPDCKNLFPKNDYYTFYKSGIDETGVFQYERADKTLLYNTEHPDPEDPLHLFVIDDGNGYQTENTTQRFIGAYLIHGHHKDIIHGISALSQAYLYTGQKEYAHKCAVLLDRYADHWPNYDARSQVYMYDVLNVTEGYVGYWFGSYSDISTIAHAYDIIRRRGHT
ncbi:MAG TPA: hypothetical protein DDZ89_17825 [Clostridiales bacterium]|nr:hypothetical protein [Clostridiales bacterium]